jgi:hypothetical protein
MSSGTESGTACTAWALSEVPESMPKENLPDPAWLVVRDQADPGRPALDRGRLRLRGPWQRPGR